MSMRKHLSRRQLTERMEQGRLAMRMLTAVVVSQGGEIRVPLAAYQDLLPTARLLTLYDAATRTYTLQAKDYEAEAPPASGAKQPTEAVRDDAPLERRAAQDRDGQGPLSDPEKL